MHAQCPPSAAIAALHYLRAVTASTASIAATLIQRNWRGRLGRSRADVMAHTRDTLRARDLRVKELRMLHPAETQAKSKRHAVLICCDVYADERIPDLSMATNDVSLMAQLLELLGYRVTILHDGLGSLPPTRANIVATLTAARARDEVLLVMWQGHGVWGRYYTGQTVLQALAEHESIDRNGVEVEEEQARARCSGGP